MIIAGPLAVHYPHLPWPRGRDHVQQLGQNCKELWTFSSVQFSRSVMSNSLQPHGLQHARPPCPSPTPRVYSNSCPLSWWCHPTISSSDVRFSSHLQSFPASVSFQKGKNAGQADTIWPHPYKCQQIYLFSCGDFSDCKSHSFLLYTMCLQEISSHFVEGRGKDVISASRSKPPRNDQEMFRLLGEGEECACKLLINVFSIHFSVTSWLA